MAIYEPWHGLIHSHEQPKSVWEGHPAKAIKKGVERTEEAFSEEDLECYHEPCTFDLVVFLLEVR